MIFIIFYYLLFYVVGIFFYNQKNNGVKYRKMHLLICFLLLFIFFGFRDLPILNDTAHYYEHFINSISNKPSSIFNVNILDRFGVGYQVYANFLILYISNDPYTIILISALIVSLFATFRLKRYTLNVGILCFFLLTSGTLLLFYSAIRQSLAVMCFFIAYKYLLRKRYIVYGVFSVVAFTFHNSAIILFLPIVFTFLKINKRNLLLSAIMMTIAVVMMGSLIDVLGFSDASYMGEEYERETFPIANFLFILFYIFIFAFCYIVGKKYKIQRPDDMTLWMSIATLLITIAAMPMGIVGRFAMYFSLFNYIMLVYYIDRLPQKVRNRYLFPLMILFMTKVVMELLIRPEWNHLYPYSFYDFFATSHETDFGY